MAPYPSFSRQSLLVIMLGCLQIRQRSLVYSWSLRCGIALTSGPRRTVGRHLHAESTSSIPTSSLLQESPIRNEQQLVENEESKLKVSAKFVPFPFQYHQEIELDIESMTNQGLGVARVVLPEGATHPKSGTCIDRPWVVMVPNVIPGERVLARVFRNYPSYSEADFIRVVGTPSPDRVLEPACPISQDCGGCQYQHISMERQRSIKTDHTKEAFQQYGLLLETDSIESSQSVLKHCTGTEETLGYRSKLTPHYDAPRKDGLPVIGFQRQTSRQVIDVESCCIATPPINAKYQQVRRELLQSFEEQQKTKESNAAESLEETNTTGKRKKKKAKGATLLFRQGNVHDDGVSTNHTETIRTTVHGVHFDYQAGNFFQNNYYVLPLMVDLVLAQATKPLATHAPPTHLLDCYCGSGLFAISCAARAQPAFSRVIGIELNAKAIEEATRNAELNGLTPDQVSFMAASAENIFAPVSQKVMEDSPDSSTAALSAPSSTFFPPDETVVVIDPPRKGCSEQFLKLLLEFSPSRVVYVSCNVVTQARDAKVLVEAGYECTYIQPLDLFPQTRHVECVASFEKKQ